MVFSIEIIIWSDLIKKSFDNGIAEQHMVQKFDYKPH
jgi:hypothetical protein